LWRPECARRREPLASLCADYTEAAAALSACASGTVGPCGRVINSPSVHGGLLCPGSRFSACRAIKGRSFKTCCYDIVVIFVPY